MDARAGSDRAVALARRLEKAASALIAVIEPIEPDRWSQVPAPGVWSIGKEAEHVAEATVMHQWSVRLTIGQKVSSRRPAIERTLMVSELSPQEMVDLIRRRTDEGRTLLLALTDEQLDQPTKPPRAQGQVLGATIERVLINHYDIHRADIEAKLHDLAGD